MNQPDQNTIDLAYLGGDAIEPNPEKQIIELFRQLSRSRQDSLIEELKEYLDIPFL